MSPCGTHGDDVVLCADCETGQWLVETMSGSLYLIDLDAMTHTRIPDPDAVDAWLASAPAPQPPELPLGVVMDTPRLRRDGDSIPLIALKPVVLGRYMDMVLDVVGDGVTYTTRSTNIVVAVTRVKPRR